MVTSTGGDGAGGRRTVSRRAAGFVAGFIGVSAPTVAIQPPHGWVAWVLLVVGSMATGLVATGLLSPILPPAPPNPPGPFWPFMAKIWNWLRGVLLPLVVLAVTLAVGFAATEGIGEIHKRLRGCTTPEEVSVVASPETLATARSLARAFELSTSNAGRNCPRASLSVYPGDSTRVRRALLDQWKVLEGGGVTADYLHDLGPRPQLWMPDSTVDVDRLTASINLGGFQSPLDQPTVYGWSPLVLATPNGLPTVPAPGGWPSVLSTFDGAGFDVVRPESTASIAGELLLAGAYPNHKTFTLADVQAAKAVEGILDRGRENARYPVGDTAALLRQYQSTGCDQARRIALILPEQFVKRPEFAGPQVRTHLGCSTDADPGSLIPLQPEPSPVLNHPVVPLSWPGAEGDPATRIAAEFARWLGTKTGAQAVEATGLHAGNRLPTPQGTSGHPAAELDLPLATAVDQALEHRKQVAHPVEILLAIDTSGSMSSRLDLGAAVLDAMAERLNDSDRLGLLTFGGSPPKVQQLVPLGLAGPERVPTSRTVRRPTTRDTVRAALLQVHPAGGTPLLRAVELGVNTLLAQPVTGGSGGAAAPIRTLVVVTDGEDTAGGTNATLLADRAQHGGVKIFAVAAGSIDCTTRVLLTITQGSDGECVLDQHGPEVAADALSAAIWGVPHG